MRFTYPDGRTLDGLSVSASLQDVRASFATAPQADFDYYPGGRAILAAVDDSDPAADYINFHRGRLEDAFDRTEEPDKICLEKAVELNPGNPFYYWYFAKATLRVTTAEGEKENTNFKIAVDKGLEIAPDNLLLRRELADYYFIGERCL